MKRHQIEELSNSEWNLVSRWSSMSLVQQDFTNESDSWDAWSILDWSF